jgi:hypothetical protein
MTEFFDSRTRTAEQGFDFAVEVEKEVIHYVSLVTGDREFPPDLREEAQRTIALWSLGPLGKLKPRPEAVQYYETMNLSRLLSDLHSFFHKVAALRLESRFGILSDDPLDILIRRDDEDETNLARPTEPRLLRDVMNDLEDSLKATACAECRRKLCWMMAVVCRHECHEMAPAQPT